MAIHTPLSSLATLPGPRPWPLIGRRGNKMLFYRDPVAYHRHIYQTFGKLAALVQGGTKVLVYAPEYNRQILSQPDLFQVDRGAIPGPPDSALQRLGSGLGWMNGDTHRQQRRLIMPAFHRQQIETYREDMVAVTQHILDRWHTGETRDINYEMRDLALCIASQTLFGIDATQQSNTLAHLIERWINLNASLALRLFPAAYPGSPYGRLLRLSDQMEAMIRAMIEQKRSALPGQRDTLTLLLHARDEQGERMGDAELIGQANLLFLAGFETTSIALTWTLFLLTQHPEVMANVHDELAGVLHGAPPTVEQLNALRLLDNVIKESLRLLPPFIHGGRIAVEPFEMGGYALPAGTKVMYSEYITHHLPEIYTQPERFMPERWQTLNPSPYEYFPFLTGRRVCIGAAFATFEMKIVLAMVLQRYRLTPPPNHIVDREVKFTLAPRHGMPMQITQQDREFARSKVPLRGNIHEMVDLGSYSKAHHN